MSGKKKKPIKCSTAQRYIRYFFFRLNLVSPFELTRHKKAIQHMVSDSIEKMHTVHCHRCWDYYQMKKRKNAGG
jgi:hypothetical protein